MASITVLIADSMRLFSESLAMALRWSPGIQVYPDLPATGPEAVEAAVRLKPDVVLIDYTMPEMDGPAAAAVLKVRAPATRVIVLSWIQGSADIQNALSAGAVGFLSRNIEMAQLVDAVHRAHAGESPVNETELREVARLHQDRADRMSELRERMAKLTPREIKLLQLLSFGRTIPEIAKELSIAQGTVKLHFNHIVKKTGAGTKEQALAMARSCGLITT